MHQFFVAITLCCRKDVGSRSRSRVRSRSKAWRSRTRKEGATGHGFGSELTTASDINRKGNRTLVGLFGDPRARLLA